MPRPAANPPLLIHPSPCPMLKAGKSAGIPRAYHLRIFYAQPVGQNQRHLD